ncbi:hypothetical protein TNCT_583821 [Trichonephila clavata]|uniref:Uncharacterized protein n=1 Tax=Trichonephila clavata TaxID=2740835 RepID=A0A8X6I1T4_TRICU|nr:hypothetical protein TNCT_583821 [Trichonephila clavata]
MNYPLLKRTLLPRSSNTKLPIKGYNILPAVTTSQWLHVNLNSPPSIITIGDQNRKIHAIPFSHVEIKDKVLWSKIGENLRLKYVEDSVIHLQRCKYSVNNILFTDRGGSRLFSLDAPC